MSEKREVEIDLDDFDLMKEVIKATPNLHYVENTMPKLLFGSVKEECKLVAIHSNGYQVGFREVDGKIKMVFDNWKDIAQNTIISKIIPSYKERQITYKLKRSRFRIRERRETKDSIILTLKS